MFDNPTGFIFRILNFALLIAVMAYFFKRYAYPALKADQEAQEARKKSLEQERELLGQAQEQLDAQLKMQEQGWLELQKKMELWQQAFAHQARAVAAERAQWQATIDQQMQERERIMSEMALQRAVLPAAVAQARRELEKTFASAEQGEQYLASLIKKMEMR